MSIWVLYDKLNNIQTITDSLMPQFSSEGLSGITADPMVVLDGVNNKISLLKEWAPTLSTSQQSLLPGYIYRATFQPGAFGEIDEITDLFFKGATEYGETGSASMTVRIRKNGVQIFSKSANMQSLSPAEITAATPAAPIVIDKTATYEIEVQRSSASAETYIVQATKSSFVTELGLNGALIDCKYGGADPPSTSSIYMPFQRFAGRTRKPSGTYTVTKTVTPTALDIWQATKWDHVGDITCKVLTLDDEIIFNDYASGMSLSGLSTDEYPGLKFQWTINCNNADTFEPSMSLPRTTWLGINNIDYWARSIVTNLDTTTELGTVKLLDIMGSGHLMLIQNRTTTARPVTFRIDGGQIMTYSLPASGTLGPLYWQFTNRLEVASTSGANITVLAMVD